MKVGERGDAMSNQTTQDERREGIRIEPPGLMPVNFEAGGDPIADAKLVNLSTQGAALLSPSPVVPGE